MGFAVPSRPYYCVVGGLALLLLLFREGTLAGGQTDVPVPIPHPLTMLLHADSVQGELGLTPEQATTVETAIAGTELRLWRLRDLPPAERARAAAPLLYSLRMRLCDVITIRQLDRLHQLALQAQGIAGLLGPEASRHLQLAPAQARRIRTALETMNGELAALRQLGAAPHGVQVQEAYQQAWSDVRALLNESQCRTLASLIGTPFNFARVRNVACKAPELQGVTAWLNSAPLTLAQCHGKVVALHFYTFGCVNCVRNLPCYNDWHTRFAGRDFVVLGIHRPETEGERDIEKVREKTAEGGQEYAIAVDNDSRNWDAWANRVWPSVYLIDKQGFIRYWWYGELNWQGAEGEKWMRDRIAELLAEP